MMKTKTSKQKRSEPIESTTAFTVTETCKSRIGWKVIASNSEDAFGPLIEISHRVKEQTFIEISREDFDRLQPGDEIRFLAVLTRPRKAKTESCTPIVPEDEMTRMNCEPINRTELTQ